MSDARSRKVFIYFCKTIFLRAEKKVCVFTPTRERKAVGVWHLIYCRIKSRRAAKSTMTSNGNPCLSPKQPNDECGDMRWISIHRRFLQECVEKDPESEWRAGRDVNWINAIKFQRWFCFLLVSFSSVCWRWHFGVVVVYWNLQVSLHELAGVWK